MKLSNTDEQREAAAQSACREVGAAVHAAHATGRALRVALSQEDLARAIRATTERLHRRDKDSLPRAMAQAEVRADLSIMRALNDRDARLSAVASIAHAADRQLAYRFELEVQSPELAREAEAAMAWASHRATGTEAGERQWPFLVEAEPALNAGQSSVEERVPVMVTLGAGRNRVASNED